MGSEDYKSATRNGQTRERSEDCRRSTERRAKQRVGKADLRAVQEKVEPARGGGGGAEGGKRYSASRFTHDQALYGNPFPSVASLLARLKLEAT